MKKKSCFMLACILLFALAGCGSAATGSGESAGASVSSVASAASSSRSIPQVGAIQALTGDPTRPEFQLGEGYYELPFAPSVLFAAGWSAQESLDIVELAGGYSEAYALRLTGPGGSEIEVFLANPHAEKANLHDCYITGVRLQQPEQDNDASSSEPAPLPTFAVAHALGIGAAEQTVRDALGDDYKLSRGDDGDVCTLAYTYLATGVAYEFTYHESDGLIVSVYLYTF